MNAVRYGVRGGLITVDGDLIDVPAPTRCFQRYGHQHRANLSSSHRAGHRQRGAVGEYYWTHPRLPGVAFPTRAAAINAVMRDLAGVR